MSDPVKAACYVRISKDREGAGLGVERQEADCRDLATRLGWEIVAVFTDNDVSAYSGKHRPQYEAMLRAVKDGQINGIVSWHTDRLTRRVVDLETLVNLSDAHGLQIQTVKAGDVNLSTPSGRMMARTLVNMAMYEVEHAKDRMRRAKEQAAKSGKYRGGPRPYGFEADGVTLRADEAEVIRDMTKAIIAGRSLISLAKELNDKGYKTSMGREWTYMRLRDVLTRPRNMGKVSTGRADRAAGNFEIVGVGNWPAIVDEDTWRACWSVLMDPKRKVHTSTEPRWLGSGTYRCGIEGCGAFMRPTSKTDGNGRRLYHYRCSDQNHLSVAANKSDDHVRETVAELISDPRVAAAMEPSDAGIKADRERRATLVRSLEQTDLDYDLDVIDAKRHKAKSERLNAEIAEIDARLTSGLRRTMTSKILNSANPGTAFRSAPVEVQRAVVRSLVTVTIRPVAKRGDKWKPERVEITRHPNQMLG